MAQSKSRVTSMGFLAETHPRFSPDAMPSWSRPSQEPHTFSLLGTLIQAFHPHYCYRPKPRPRRESHPPTLDGFEPGLLFSAIPPSSLSRPKSSCKPHSQAYSMSLPGPFSFATFPSPAGMHMGHFLDFHPI